MKKSVKYLALFFMMGAILTSCDEKHEAEVMELNETSNSPTLKSEFMGDWVPMDDPSWWYTVSPGDIEMCKDEMVLPFYDAAKVHFFNDDSYMYVRVVAEENWLIKYFSMNIWAIGDPNIKSDYNSFPFQKADYGAEMDNTITYKIPYDERWRECFILNVKLACVNGNSEERYWWLTNDNVRGSEDYFIEYCWRNCCVPEGFRTQTQGGWGTKPNGNNPGMYRSDHFDNVFPVGLSVGGDYLLLLTSSQAVEDFLPSGGKPSALDGNYDDPSSKELKNAFAAQVVALTLSVEFDKSDPDFSMTEYLLEDLVFAEGTGFEGYSVAEILADANKVLGGGSSDYGFSLKDLHNILDAVNNSFVDGKVSGEYSILVCHSNHL